MDGAAVLQVGVRSRGDGSRSEEKPGLKVEFDKYVPAQEYYGYKSLVIDNLTQDASFLRERLSFLVFEAMGIAAPRNAFARLTVNGEYWGLFALVEPVSKPFLEARLGEKSGTLFDYEWVFPYDFSWLGPSPRPTCPCLSSRRRTKSARRGGRPRRLRRGDQLTRPTPPSSPRWGPGSTSIASSPTWRSRTRIAEGDGIVGDHGLNNFYLYEYGAKNRFVFIPWDKDNTFRSGTWPLYRHLETNVLTRRLTADPAKRQVYADAVVRATSSYVNPRWLTPQLETAYQQIRSAVQADTRKPFTNAQFEAAVDGVRGVIAAREGDVKAQR